MAIDEQTYEQIDRFLRGAMDANERLVFEQRLRDDDALRDEVEWMKNMSQEMKNMGREVLKRQIAAIGAAVPAKELASYSPTQNAVAPPKTSSMSWWWVLVVVGAIGAAIFWYVKETRHDSESSFFQSSDEHRAPEFISGGEIKQGELPASDTPRSRPMATDAASEDGCPVRLLTVQKANKYASLGKVENYDPNFISVVNDTIVREFDDGGGGIDRKLVRDTQYKEAYQVKMDGSSIAVHFCEKQTDAVFYRFDDAHLYLDSRLTEKSGLVLRDGGDGKHVLLELPNGLTYQIKNAGKGAAVLLNTSKK